MKPRMSAKRAIAVCGRGPKTEAQRTQAMAALKRLGQDMARDYPGHCADTLVDIAVERAALRDAPLRGQA